MDSRWKLLRIKVVLSDSIWIALFGWLAIDQNPLWWIAVAATVAGWFFPREAHEIPLFHWRSKK